MSHLVLMTRSAFIAMLVGIAAHSFAQEITASPEQRRAIEAQMTFFQVESDAIRVAAGFGRGSDVDDCVLQGAVAALSYLCPAPSDSRDRVKSALIAREWIPTTIPTSDPWYALYAFRKGASLAFFVCAPGRKSCLLELQQRN